MESKLQKLEDGTIEVTIKIRPEGNLFEQETQIAEALAEAGRLAMEARLVTFDSDGSAIIVSNAKYTSKGRKKKPINPFSEKSQ
jgi:hypothetical protein